MSDFRESRALRLERLESRSMLAGGVFVFEVAADDVDSGHRHSNRQGDSGRPDEVARIAPQSARIDASPGRQDTPRQSQSDRSHGSDHNSLRSDRLVVPAARHYHSQQNQFLQNLPASEANEVIVLTLLQATASAGSPSTPNQTESSPPTTLPPLSFAASVDRTANQTLRPEASALSSLPTATSTEAALESKPAISNDDVVNMSSATSSQIDATEGIGLQQEVVQEDDAVVQTASDRVHAAEDGWIDLATIGSFDAFTENSDQSDPWKLDLQTIPLLRQLTQHAVGEYIAGDRTVGRRAELADQMIRDWFNGPGGLIALDQVDLPGVTFPHDAARIHVGLQSTVALHRSLNLVASGVTPALSGPVLDAIMASLDQMASSETQPVIEPSPLRIPSMAYPAVAIVATTVAVSARRKHKQPHSNQQFTGNQ
ncbi:MAG: hypothetical protein HKN47_27390 [Pirellulaceae bacterium]|nr:hypothetical protein [Pirellulaceae bacterium]